MRHRPPGGRFVLGAPTAVAISTLLAGILSAGPASARPASRDLRVARHRAPVVVVVFENHEYGSIMHARSAGYFRSFARRGRLFTRFHALHHPSLPNYLEMTSGQTNGCRSDGCPKRRYRTNNVFHQLSTNLIPWAGWIESMRSTCQLSSSSNYAAWHNAPLYYRRLFPRICPTRDRPYPRRLPHPLPRFVLAVPNQCHSMHDCSIAAGNRWLKAHVPPLLHRGAVVVVTFDEGTGHDGGGGHIYTAVAGHGVPHGRRDGHRYNHRSLLAGIERWFGLPRLNGARHARPLPI